MNKLTLAIKLISYPLLFISLMNNAWANDDDLPVLESIQIEREVNDYTRSLNRTATKFVLSHKETPQSVSNITQKQINDQNLTDGYSILKQVAGISTVQRGQQGAGYSIHTARGFAVTNVQRDGVPSTLASFGGRDFLGAENSIIYDSIEVVRGATSLTNGAGNPSASINYMRKRPTVERKGNVNIQAGSWNNYRTSFDVSGGLNADNSLRGRFIASYNQGDGHQPRFHQRGALLYGALDYDVTPQTTFTSSLSLQRNQLDDVTARGFPFLSADQPKAVTPFTWKDNPASDFAYTDLDRVHLLVGLEHRFTDDWFSKVNYNYTKTESDRLYSVAGAGGGGVALSGDISRNGQTILRKGQMMVSSGRFHVKPTTHSIDAHFSGKFNAFGKKHDVVLGANAFQSKSTSPGYGRLTSVVDVANWNGSLGNQAQNILNQLNTATATEYLNDKQWGIFTATHLKVSEPFKVLLGTRLTHWQRDEASRPRGDLNQRPTQRTQKKSGFFTPYVGLTYDFTPQLTAYGNYSKVFQAQDERNENAQYLDPLEGHTYEVGLKGAFFDNRLNGTLTYFYSDLDNMAVHDGDKKIRGTQQAYKMSDGKVKGYEVLLDGHITPQWNIQAGYSYTDTKQADGNPLNTEIPKQQFKLFSTYQWDKLTVGGGVNWQSKTYLNGTLDAMQRQYNQQPAYALWNAMARYQITPKATLGINVDNLTNKMYKTDVEETWGTPRKLTASFNYQF